MIDINIYIIAKLILSITLFAIVFIYFIYKSKNSNSKKAETFIDGLYDVLKEEMLSIITNINPQDFTTFDDFRELAVSSIYTKLKEYKLDIVEKEKDPLLNIAVIKIIENESFIEKSIEQIINNFNIDERLDAIWNKKIEKESDSIKEEDKKLQKDFSDESKYVESVDISKLPDANIEEPTQEELDKLNPQIDISDSDVEYDPENDESVELIEDDTFIDSNGRKRSKSTGRFVKE